MFYQWFLKKKYALQLGLALLIALLTLVVPQASASAQSVIAKRAAGEIAPVCVSLQTKLNNTENEIAMLTAELNEADPAEKAALAQQIKKESVTENQEVEALNACVAANPGLPPLNATLTGTITFIISSDGFEEHTAPISMGITFSAFRDEVNFSLPPTNVPGAPVTTTASTVSAGTGTFNQSSGAMSEATELLFDFHLSGLVTNSTGDFTFTTGSSVSPDGQVVVDGSPLNSQSGGIELVAATQFNNGELSGVDGAIFLIGKITPLP